MTTTHYNFPTITGTDTIDGVNAINGLANAVDSALYGVANDAASTAESAQSTAQSALSQIGKVTQTQTSGTGGTAIYVYNPNTKLVVIRGYGSGLDIPSGKGLSLGTIPSNLRPARQYESGVIGSASGGGALLTFSANADGTILIRNQTTSSLNNVMYNGQVVYYIGV